MFEEKHTKPPNKECKIFGIGKTRSFAECVCKKLGIGLSPISEEKFPDGELKVHAVEDVNKTKVFVFHSLIDNTLRTVNDRLCELYFLLSSLRDQGAYQVTAVIPYLCYARSDRRKEPFDSLTLRHVAQMLEGSGVHQIICMDVHNISAFENAFRCSTLHLEADSLFCDYIADQISEDNPPFVLSPDIGGIKRAERFRKQLERVTGISIELAFFEKFRTQQGLIGQTLVGDVKGHPVLIIDDMISTGETILRAIDACHKEGVSSIRTFASHGLFTKNQAKLLNSPLIEELIVTDSHPDVNSHTLNQFSKLKVLSCSSLFAEAIGRLT